MSKSLSEEGDELRQAMRDLFLVIAKELKIDVLVEKLYLWLQQSS